QGRGQIPPVMDMSRPEEKAAQRDANARHEALAAEIEAFELIKFPRPEGEPLTASPEAMRLPGNLPVTHARTEPRRRNVNGLLEAIPHFEATDPKYAAVLQKLLEAVRARDAANAAITRVMIMDQMEEPRETFILEKGNYQSKSDVRVFGAIPEMFRTSGLPGRNDGSTLEPRPPDLPLEKGAVESTPPRLNRLDLARWLVSPGNPLV